MTDNDLPAPITSAVRVSACRRHLRIWRLTFLLHALGGGGASAIMLWGSLLERETVFPYIWGGLIAMHALQLLGWLRMNAQHERWSDAEAVTQLRDAAAKARKGTRPNHKALFAITAVFGIAVVILFVMELGGLALSSEPFSVEAIVSGIGLPLLLGVIVLNNFASWQRAKRLEELFPGNAEAF